MCPVYMYHVDFLRLAFAGKAATFSMDSEQKLASKFPSCSKCLQNIFEIWPNPKNQITSWNVNEWSSNLELLVPRRFPQMAPNLLRIWPWIWPIPCIYKARSRTRSLNKMCKCSIPKHRGALLHLKTWLCFRRLKIAAGETMCPKALAQPFAFQNVYISLQPELSTLFWHVLDGLWTQKLPHKCGGESTFRRSWEQEL